MKTHRRARARARARARPDESGFTLAELLLAIAIETIIFGALATAFVVVLNGGSSVNENLGKSADARFLRWREWAAVVRDVFAAADAAWLASVPTLCDSRGRRGRLWRRLLGGFGRGARSA